MSITTKRGDDGTTSLLHHRRVSKTDPRVKTCGLIDELNARLGQAQALLAHADPATAAWIQDFQRSLFILMGEVAVDPADFAAHEDSALPKLDPSFLKKLETRCRQRELQLAPLRDWALPGANTISASLDLARTAARQAEIALWELDGLKLLNPARKELILIAFNRLSDLLWIEARLQEGQKSPELQARS